MDFNGIPVHLPDDIGPRFGEFLSLFFFFSLSLSLYVYGIHIYIYTYTYDYIYIYYTYTQHTMVFFSNWEACHPQADFA